MGISTRGSPVATMTVDQIHTPVMLARTLELLGPALARENAVVVDATLGIGGHAEAILERFPGVTLLGIDRDTDALALARERLAPFGNRVFFQHAVYDQIDRVVKELGFATVDGILFDLGVSSLQLDEVERGFSYSKDAPLDMRMDATTGVTAAAILATYSEDDLKRIFYEYGDEKLAPRYASRIVRQRDQAALTSSAQLVDLISAATPAAAKRAGHPAKRVFQALRIEVNQELSVLRDAIPRALDLLGVEGRMIVLSYQSLEDRIVKRAIGSRVVSTAPRGLPVELPEHRPELKLLVRGAELASADERNSNPRSSSVRLRAVERVRGPL